MSSLSKMLRMITQACKPTKTCELCRLSHGGAHALCQTCMLAFPTIPFPCKHCAIPLPDSAPPFCGQCINKVQATDQVIAPYVFKEPLRSFIHQFKYNGGLHLSSMLSELLLNFLPTVPCPNVLIPMPMHAKRTRTRGFNQTILLTKYLSKRLQIPYDADVCKKIKHTAAQASLPANMRQNNLSHTFYIKPNHYQNVVIIDDVYTTGSSVQSLAKSLKASGVHRVEAWCVARTCPN